MSEALARIEVPAKLPPGVTRRQWRYAMLLPTAVANYLAAKEAGYSDSSAEKAAGRLAASLGVRIASEAIAKGKLDSARDIKRKAGSKVSAELDEKQVDPSFALSAWATASKIESEYPDADTGVGEAEHAAARLYVERLVRFATEALIRKYSLHNIDAATALSAEDVAAIAVAAQAP